MVIVALNTNNLNVSLQVGDLIYAKSTFTQYPTGEVEQQSTTTEQRAVGILRRIDTFDGGVALLVDETAVDNPYSVVEGDFVMFSKYDQSMGDVIGYYAKVKFVNNSREKAEIFSVGSEVTINSK